jgi:hypothetical protein
VPDFAAGQKTQLILSAPQVNGLCSFNFNATGSASQGGEPHHSIPKPAALHKAAGPLTGADHQVMCMAAEGGNVAHPAPPALIVDQKGV